MAHCVKGLPCKQIDCIYNEVGLCNYSREAEIEMFGVDEDDDNAEQYEDACHCTIPV